MPESMRSRARRVHPRGAPTLGRLSPAMEVDRRIADLGLHLVDGSIVALGESLGIYRLAARDGRHFAGVRRRDGRSYELVVHPTVPERP
jgi:hypothetical protein